MNMFVNPAACCKPQNADLNSVFLSAGAVTSQHCLIKDLLWCLFLLSTSKNINNVLQNNKSHLCKHLKKIKNECWLIGFVNILCIFPLHELHEHTGVLVFERSNFQSIFLHILEKKWEVLGNAEVLMVVARMLLRNC